VKPWVAYSLVRIGVFAVAFAILMVLKAPFWLAAIVAAIIGLCVGYIFFGKLRDAVALDIVARRSRAPKDSDAEVEDRQL
jgi:tetrahydromethanopterin S-methyltransferase subunit C